MKTQGNKKEKSAAIVGIVLVVAIMALTALGTGKTSAQWKTGNPVFEAVGTVISKNYQELMPVGPKEQEQVYTKVVFRTDDKTTFVIPFRPRDIEAIPSEGNNIVYWACGSAGACTFSSSTPPSLTTHGILRYHNCDGYLYCFDSFTETEAPKSSGELTTKKK